MNWQSFGIGAAVGVGLAYLLLSEKSPLARFQVGERTVTVSGVPHLGIAERNYPGIPGDTYRGRQIARAVMQRLQNRGAARGW